MAEILAELDAVLKNRAPLTYASLSIGLAIDEIVTLEKSAGVKFHDDLATLYQWHNGQRAEVSPDFIPGHYFPPIQWVVDDRNVTNQQLKQATVLQRVAYWLSCRHRKNWFTLFDDGAGDGYFHDYTRNQHEGPVFYNFQEIDAFTYYPSIKNLLAAITQCYESGAFQVNAFGRYNESFEQSAAIMANFGQVISH